MGRVHRHHHSSSLARHNLPAPWLRHPDAETACEFLAASDLPDLIKKRSFNISSLVHVASARSAGQPSCQVSPQVIKEPMKRLHLLPCRRQQQGGSPR